MLYSSHLWRFKLVCIFLSLHIPKFPPTTIFHYSLFTFNDFNLPQTSFYSHFQYFLASFCHIKKKTEWKKWKKSFNSIIFITLKKATPEVATKKKRKKNWIIMLEKLLIVCDIHTHFLFIYFPCNFFMNATACGETLEYFSATKKCLTFI